MKIIFINTAVYILLLYLGWFWNSGATEIVSALSLPGSFSALPSAFWTPLTYMWIHLDFWHLLFNMAWLYWMGSMFLQVFSSRRMVVLYISGGLCGALLYLAFFSLSMNGDTAHHSLLGASAAVMAIVTATALKRPDYKCKLPLIGAVALKWIALVALILGCADFIEEAGGSSFAHLGGAIAGVVYLVIVAPRRVKATPKRETKYDNVDSILEKIKQSGYSALTDEEKRRLFDVKKPRQ